MDRRLRELERVAAVDPTATAALRRVRERADGPALAQHPADPHACAASPSRRHEPGQVPDRPPRSGAVWVPCVHCGVAR